MRKISFSLSSAIFFIGTLILLLTNEIKAQTPQACTITANASKTNINCGETVTIGAVATAPIYVTAYQNNFNDGTIGPGWSSAPGAVVFTNPCGAGPAGTGAHAWFGGATNQPRSLETVNYDVRRGGKICFDMRYAEEGALSSGDCEGPDLTAEGVHLQYNIGSGWVEINYWDPSGPAFGGTSPGDDGHNPALVNWTNRCIDIPIAALTANTKFRWYQDAGSGAGADHWGLDNIEIKLNDPRYRFFWSHLPSYNGATPPPVSPGTTTTYQVIYKDTTATSNIFLPCTASVTITVTNNISLTAFPLRYNICPGDTTQLLTLSNLFVPDPNTCELSSMVSCGGGYQTAVKQIGTGTTVNSWNSITGNTFGDFGDNNYRTQIIYHDDEVKAMLPAGKASGLLSSIAFDIAVAGQTGTNTATGSMLYPNLKILISCTDKEAFTTSADIVSAASLVQVYSGNPTLVPGWNTFTFTNPYEWDGTKNIIVQVCWNQTNGQQTTASKTRDHNPGFIAFQRSNINSSDGTGVCNTGTTFEEEYQQRPNTRFTVCTATPTPNIRFEWTPIASLNNPNINDPIATPPATTEYTCKIFDINYPQCFKTDTANVKIRPLPAKPNAISNNYCSNGTINLSVSPSVAGVIYNWTGPGGWTATGVAVSRATAPAGNYIVTPVLSTCAGEPDTVVIKQTPPQPTAVTAIRQCEGPDLVITIPGAALAGATYNWTGPGGFTATTASQTVTRTASVPAMSGTYNVTATVNGCTGIARAITVTIDPASVSGITAINNGPKCINPLDSIFLTANSHPQIGGPTTIPPSTDYYEYTWFGPAFPPGGYVTPGGPPNYAPNTVRINGATLANAGDYYVSIARKPKTPPTIPLGGNTCPSYKGKTTVSINPPPTAPIVAPVTICSGNTATLTVNPATAGVNYEWFTVPAGGAPIFTGNPYTTPALVANTTYYVQANSGCISSRTAVPVTVNPVYNATSIAITPASAGNNYCVGDNVTLTVTPAIVGAIYNWTTTATGTVIAPGLRTQNIASVILTNDGNYSATITLAGCTGTATAANLIVNPLPAAPTVAPVNICHNSTATLTATAPGGTYKWYDANTAGNLLATNPSYTTPTLTNNTGSDQVTNYYVNTTSAAGCVSANRTTVPVTVHPQNFASFTYGSGSYCNADPTDPTPTVITSGGTFSASGGIGINSTTGQLDVSTGTAGTSYTITYTVGGCNSSSNIQITGLAKADFTLGTYCEAGSVNPSPTFGAGAAAGTFSANSTNLKFISTSTGQIDLANSLPGTYTVTNTVNTTGCGNDIKTDDVTITPRPVAPTVSGAGAICKGSSANLNATAPGGTYNWYDAGGTLLSSTNPYAPSPTSNTNYFVNATDGLGCISLKKTVPVTVDYVTSAAGTDQTVCAANQATLTGAIGGGTTTTGVWSTSGTGTFDNANSMNAAYASSTADNTTGSVTLTLTSTNNGACTAATDNVVITLDKVHNVSAGVDGTVCEGSNYNLLGTITGGSTTGSWTGGAGTFTPNRNTPTPSYLPTTAEVNNTIPLTLTSNAGGNCPIANDQMFLQVVPLPVAKAGNDQNLCSSSPAFLSGIIQGSATGGVWSTPNGTGTFDDANVLSTIYRPSLADATAGTVTLRLTTTGSTYCNPVSDDLILNLEQAAIANAGNDAPVCEGDAITLNGSIGGSASNGTWSTSGTGTFAPNATTLNATYTPSAADIVNGIVSMVLYTDDPSGGCSAATDQMDITITKQPVVDAGNPTEDICYGSLITLSDALITPIGTSILWTSSGTGTFDNNQSMNPTYTASKADSTAGFVDLTMNGIGCKTITDVLRVNIHAVKVDAGSDNAICETKSHQLNGTMNGTPSITWTTTGGGYFDNASSLTAKYVPSSLDIGNGYTNLIINSVAGGVCPIKSDTMRLNVNRDAIAMVVENSKTFCQGTQYTLTGGVTGATTNGTWNGGTGVFVPDRNDPTARYTPSLSEINAGYVKLDLIPTYSGSCSAIPASVELFIDKAHTVSAGADNTFCFGSPVTLSGTFGGGATKGKWTGGIGTYNPDEFDPNAIYTPDATELNAKKVILSFTTEAAGTCPVNADQVTMNLIEALTSTFTIPAAICDNETAMVNYTGNVLSGGTFTWNFGDANVINGNGTGPGPHELEWNTPGLKSIILLVNDNNNCSSPSTPNSITVNETPIAAFKNDPTICVGEILDLSFNGTAIPIANFDWSFDNAEIVSGIANGPYKLTWATPGTKNLSLSISQNGCESGEQLGTVNVVPNTIAAIVTDPPITGPIGLNAGSIRFIDASTDGANPEWTLEDGSISYENQPARTFTDTGTYTINLKSGTGNCTDVSSFTLKVEGKSILEVPSAFSPNGDGGNNIFIPNTLNIVSGVFTVYNRWGEIIYKSNNLQQGWDGTFKGQPAPGGVYVYTVQGMGIEGTIREKNGLVTLVR